MKPSAYEYHYHVYWAVVAFEGITVPELMRLFPKRFWSHLEGELDIYLWPDFPTEYEAVSYAQRFIMRFEEMFEEGRPAMRARALLSLGVAYASVA